MRRTVRLIALVAMTLGLLACSEEEERVTEAPAEEPIPELSVAEVASMLDRGDCLAVDANSPATRAEQGVVPGARLLSSSGSYDPEAELPSDTSTHLVFYCANENCHASDGAAQRARQAGYRNVNVMREGIAGWKAAGHETEGPEA